MLVKNQNLNKVRLQIILRDSLGISRRASEVLIKNQKVTINGNIAKLGDSANSYSDSVAVDGVEIKKNSKKLLYIALNKPDGCLTTRSDPFKRKTIYDLLPDEYKSLFPIGRLDFHTEGLILLTNDGDLTLTLTHPKYEVEKEYVVRINKDILDSDISKCAQGFKSQEITTGPVKITFNTDRRILNVVIQEGQNREIRRLFEAMGYKVDYLKRIRILNLKLSTLNLSLGSYRIINKDLILG